MIRTIARTTSRAGLAAALAVLAACQGSSATSSGTATLNVHLVDGPPAALEYTQLNLHIERVELATAATDGGAWTVLGSPNKTVNLLALTGGIDETLVNGASIPAGSYGQLRLILGDGNTICTAPVAEDGTCPANALHDLKVPSGLQTGVKIDVHFDVQPDTTKDVFIDFDAHRSVFVHAAGHSGQYILRPVVRGYDLVVTGAVKGVVTDATTQAPLAGIDVMAETLDGQGNPSVARTAKTGSDGSYVLDLLPVGGSYWVVGQPRVGTAAYQAGAAGPFDVTATAPVVTSNVAFAPASATGGVAGTIAPVAQSGVLDEVMLLGTVASHTFLLRDTGADVATDGSSETWSIDLLPPATYRLFVTRATPVDGGYTYATGPLTAATVDAGATTHIALGAP